MFKFCPLISAIFWVNLYFDLNKWGRMGTNYVILDNMGYLPTPLVTFSLYNFSPFVMQSHLFLDPPSKAFVKTLILGGPSADYHLLHIWFQGEHSLGFCVSRRVEWFSRVEQCQLLRIHCATSGSLQGVLSVLRRRKKGCQWIIIFWTQLIIKLFSSNDILERKKCSSVSLLFLN